MTFYPALVEDNLTTLDDLAVESRRLRLPTMLVMRCDYCRELFHRTWSNANSTRQKLRSGAQTVFCGLSCKTRAQGGSPW